MSWDVFADVFIVCTLYKILQPMAELKLFKAMNAAAHV